MAAPYRPWSGPAVGAGSRFAIAANVVCFEVEAVMPVVPVPPVFVPTWDEGRGQDEAIVSRHDGGHYVARG